MSRRPPWWARRHAGLQLGAVLAIAAPLTAAQDAPVPDAAPAPQAQPDPAAATRAYLRVVEERGRSIALEVASRRFAPAAGEGPDIWLVGAAHIGEAAFFRSLQSLLDGAELVLYESVKPAGAGGASGTSDEERAESSLVAIEFVAKVIELHAKHEKRYPADAAELQAFAARLDPRLGQWTRDAMIDGWGRAIAYTPPATAGAMYAVRSLGADGAPGGDGAAGDLDASKLSPVAPLELPGDDGIQGELAAALGLAFQLNAISYDRPGWRCSDMAIDEIDRALRARGSDFALLGGTLDGTSLPARVATVMLRLMRLADAFTQGAVSDLFKVIMIEVLGDPTVVNASLDQLGGGFKEVIVDQRNQVAIDDARAALNGEPAPRVIAVFYGAAHLDDLEKRLNEQLGWQPVETRWFRAIGVDLQKSRVDPRQLQQMRMMMRRMMRQQLGRPAMPRE
jgi:hypothetical protein